MDTAANRNIQIEIKGKAHYSTAITYEQMGRAGWVEEEVRGLQSLMDWGIFSSEEFKEHSPKALDSRLKDYDDPQQRIQVLMASAKLYRERLPRA